MRILILNWKDHEHPAAGGAEVFVERLVEEWVKQHHLVTVFTPSSGRLLPLEERDGIVRIRRGNRLSVYREAKRFLQSRSSDFDVVVDSINTRPFLAPRYSAAPVVALAYQVCREVWWDELPFPLAAAGRFVLEPWWLSRYRNIPVITISQSSRRSLAAYGIHNVVVVPVAVDPVPVVDVEKEARPTIIFVGRLANNKRPGEAIAAFRVVKAAMPEAQMWVIGSGPMLRRLATGAPPDVYFLGRVGEQEKAELMARAHVLVVTSRREGWGLVVTEAAALGTPSVCYDVPGLRDSVAATGVGRLVACDARALGTELVTVLEHGTPAPVRHEVTWSMTADACLGALAEAARDTDRSTSCRGGNGVRRASS